MTQKHTPTPWVAEWSNRSGSAEQEHKGWHIFNPLTLNDEGLIAELPDDNENRMGDAAFIARACNAHDELIEALNGMLEVFVDSDQLSDCEDMETVKAARNALTKARKEA